MRAVGDAAAAADCATVAATESVNLPELLLLFLLQQLLWIQYAATRTAYAYVSVYSCCLCL